MYAGALVLVAASGCNQSASEETKADKNTVSVDSTAAEATENKTEVTIGKQIWMTQNLNVDKFRNGDPIPEAKSDEDWRNAYLEKKPAWCYYNDNPDNGERYGKLYNWYAVNDPRGLAPKGWKVPSEADWSRLIDFLGGGNIASKKMKSNEYWADYEGNSGNGNNESGFIGLPGGFRWGDIGSCESISEEGDWWSSTAGGNEFLKKSLYLSLDADGSAALYTHDRGNGLSVRCVKN